MDTREKIVPVADLRRRMGAGEWLAAVGLFDPLTAAQAARLADMQNGCGNLLAIVLDEPDTLLTADARAALIAGLRGVRLVAVARTDEWKEALAGLRVKILDDGQAERIRSREFVEFVFARQSSG